MPIATLIISIVLVYGGVVLWSFVSTIFMGRTYLVLSHRFFHLHSTGLAIYIKVICSRSGKERNLRKNFLVILMVTFLHNTCLVSYFDGSIQIQSKCHDNFTFQFLHNSRTIRQIVLSLHVLWNLKAFTERKFKHKYSVYKIQFIILLPIYIRSNSREQLKPIAPRDGVTGIFPH